MMLVIWRIWKVRNDCVFNNRSPNNDETMALILGDVELWTAAGNPRLADIGWPGSRARTLLLDQI